MTQGDHAASVYDVGVKAAIVLIAGGVLSAFLTLQGPVAEPEAAATWLDDNGGRYILGWLNQIVMMMASSVIFAVAGWSIFAAAPLSAVAVWALTLISAVVFFITKFLAVWTTPFAAEALAAGGAGRDSAELMLSLLVSDEAFGLISSLDYLGFWLYALIGLGLARPLLRQGSTAATVAAVALLAYGVAMHLAFAAALIGVLDQGSVYMTVMSLGALLIPACVALLFHFRAQIAVGGAPATAA